MPFTIEQIATALLHGDEFERGDVVFKSAGYKIIVAYLTGESASLNALQQNDDYYHWGSIIHLLKSVDPISPDDQLVLDVIYHPQLFAYTSFNFNNWLLDYVLKQNTPSALNAVLGEFRKQGMNDDQFFEFLLFSFGYHHNQEEIPGIGLFRNFLIDHLKKVKQLPYPSHGYLAWNREWSRLYFTLLEEARPDFLEEYILYGLRSDRNSPIAFLLVYKDGKYIDNLMAFIADLRHDDLPARQTKLATALKLYQQDQQRYTSLALELAERYLDGFTADNHQQYWEGGHHISGLGKTNIEYLSFSAYAFHLLLLHNRQKGIQKINDWLQRNIFIHAQTLQLFYHHLQQETLPFFEAALQRDITRGGHAGVEYFRFNIEFIAQHFPPGQYLPFVWKLVASKSKSLREWLAPFLAGKDQTAEQKGINLLDNKNAESRLTAALILSNITTPTSKAAIMKVLNTEKNDNTRDVLLQTIAGNLPTQSSMGFIDDIIQAARSRGKLSKPVETWLEESSLPALFYTTGQELTIDEKRFLLYRMSRIKEMRSDMEARYILQFLDKEKSSAFALHIMKLYIEKGAKPEHKYLMALAALLGNDTVVDKIRITTNKWIEESRYKMAEHGVGALALQGGDKALRWVEWFSRKYKTKKANVGTAALVALETAAEELGITIHELGDRIVPDFGFVGLFKHFTVGDEEYRAFIDSNFKMAFFDEDNKKLKAIPAAADAALKEAFKAIAKEVRDIVKSQSSRLEYYLVIQRRWALEKWQQFFLQNPVMFIYATKFLWGTYDETGGLTGLFICSEDSSLLNIDNEEISLDENSRIGIVHPSQLDAALLQQWQQHFFDMKIDPVFPQLDRRMPRLEDFDLSKPIMTRFEGKQMKEGSIRSTLEKYGWHKGPTGDGGMLESFKLLYFEKKIEAVLEVDGVGAGYGWGMEEKLGRLYVVDKSKLVQRWFHPKDDKDENLVAFKEVPTIFLCEALAAIESIKAFEPAVR